MVRSYLAEILLFERRWNIPSNTSGSNKPEDIQAIKEFLQHLFQEILLPFTVPLKL